MLLDINLLLSSNNPNNFARIQWPYTMNFWTESKPKPEEKMSTSTPELQQALNEKEKYNQILRLALEQRNDTLLDNALRGGANINERFLLSDGTIAKYPPLMYAVSKYYEYAVQRLTEQGVDTEIFDDQGIPLLMIAIEFGNPAIVDMILRAMQKKKLDVNQAYDEMSPLAKAILCASASSFTLIFQESSKWSNAAGEQSTKIARGLQNWFLGKQKDFSDGALRVTSPGAISIIGALLLHGVDAEAPDVDNITPLMLLKNPKKYIQEFIDQQNNSTFRSQTGNVISFSLQIANMHKEKLQIIFDYDLSHMLTMIETHLDRKNRKAQQEVNLDHITKQLEETNQEIAKRRLSLERVKGSLEQVQTKVTPMLHMYDTHQAPKYDRKKKISVIREVESLRNFYDEFSIGLKGIFNAYEAISTGMITREHYKGKDKIADAASALSEFVPSYGGTAIKIVAVILQKYSDYTEERKSQNIVHRIGPKPLKLCEDLAMQLINNHAQILTRCTPDAAKALAGQAMDTIVGRLGADANLPEGEALITQLISESDISAIFARQEQELQDAETRKLQAKESAKSPETPPKKSTVKKLKEKFCPTR
jgi:hypothetical protein